MFRKWTLFRFLLFFSITACHADLYFSYSKLSAISDSQFTKEVSDPFSTYLLAQLKKRHRLSLNVLHFREIKDFINKLKLFTRVSYLANLTYHPYPTKPSKLSFSVSDSWTLGPNGGMITSYIITDSLQVLGKTAENYVLTKIKAPYTESAINLVDLKEQFFKQPTTDFGFGLGYKLKISKKNLTLRTFYDFNIISDLDSLIQRAKLMNKSTISLEDFYFHGLSGILKFDF